MTPEQVQDAAERLYVAELSRQQIDLLTKQYPHMGLDEAYAVQSALVARKKAAGAKRIGWKIGLTSKAMQYALNIDIPDSGVLFDDMVLRMVQPFQQDALSNQESRRRSRL